MPKIHGKNTRVYIGGYDLSTWFRQADVGAIVDISPTEAFGDTDKSVVVGQMSGDLKLGGYYDNASGTASLDALMHTWQQAAADPILCVVRNAGINEAGAGMVAPLKAYSPNAPIAGVVTVSAEFGANGTGADRIRSIMPYGTVTPTAPFGTTASYNGGTATLLGMTGYLQAFAVLAGTPVITIDHSMDGATAWSTYLTFAAMPLAASAPQAQKVTVTGGSVRPFLRASVTGGSAVAFVGVNQPVA